MTKSSTKRKESELQLLLTRIATISHEGGKEGLDNESGMREIRKLTHAWIIEKRESEGK